MAQKAGYQGIKKLTSPLDITTEGTLFIEENYYQKTELSEPIEGHSTVEGALGALSTNKMSYADNGVLGAKNFFDLNLDTLKAINTSGTWSANALTVNSITFTYYKDHIAVSGTASANTAFLLSSRNDDAYTCRCKKGRYIVSGRPNIDDPKIRLNVAYALNGSAEIITSINSGTEAEIEITDSMLVSGQDYCALQFIIVDQKSGKSYNVYPMIRLATDPDPTYQPHAQTNRQLTVNKADNSVIAPVENGTTVQKQDGYAVGSHAIRNGAFITWKNAKAQGETINDASDYTSGDVADILTTQSSVATQGPDATSLGITLNSSSDHKTLYKYGDVVSGRVRFDVADDISVTTDKGIITLPYAPKVSNPRVEIINTTTLEIVGACFINSSNNRITLKNISLVAGTYDITFTYI